MAREIFIWRLGLDVAWGRGGGGSEPRDSNSNGCWKDDGPFVRFKLAKVKAIGIFLTYKLPLKAVGMANHPRIDAYRRTDFGLPCIKAYAYCRQN